jgi:hypothetical protein
MATPGLYALFEYIPGEKPRLLAGFGPFNDAVILN